MVSTEEILYSPGDYVVDPRLTISRRGTFVKDIGYRAILTVYTLFEYLILLPKTVYLLIDCRKIQLLK
jgi:hypothetical protein